MTISLIITAAGSSRRFNRSIPKAEKQGFSSKLLYSVGDKPVLLQTLSAFLEEPSVKEIFITSNPELKKEMKPWLKDASFKKVKWVTGGETRSESVLQALKKCQYPWVMVQDAARPLLNQKSLRGLIRSAKNCDGIILGKKVSSTIKRVKHSRKEIIETVNRDELFEAETPQLIKRRKLLEAYKKIKDYKSYTDEAGLLEAIDAKLKFYSHDQWNPKLTLYSDLEMIRSHLGGNEKIEKTGIGYDIHQLVPGRTLWLGGVKIPHDKGLLGHSDGDVVIHAIIDGILGALGWGDIGEWFSDQDKKFKGIRSDLLLKKVMKSVFQEDWKVDHVDMNLIVQKPKVGPHKAKIKKYLASLLKTEAINISVKARTHEGLGPIGREEAMACQTIVQMRKER